MLSALLRSRATVRVLGARWQSSGSFFQNLPGAAENPQQQQSAQPTEYSSNADLREHPEVRAFLNPAPQKTIDLLSPLKRALYLQNLANNNGSFVNNELVAHEGKTYRLRLTREEQRALEPSVYVQSYRIKGSWKKSYMFLRIFRRMPLLDAVTQCHFSARRMARDVGEMLERGKKDAEALGLAPEDLVVDQIWVGKDGSDPKRLQCKGRGRTGVVVSPYVHVKAVLKPREVYERREEYMKKRLDRKLWQPLRNWKIKEDFVQTAEYKW